jgi:hypothetical protein
MLGPTQKTSEDALARVLVLLHGLYYDLFILSKTIQEKARDQIPRILRCLQSTSEDALVRASCCAERLVEGTKPNKPFEGSDRRLLSGTNAR